MTYWALGCVQKCDLWAWRRNEKKDRNFHASKLAICPDHPRRRRPLKFCVRGRVREVVIYFKFHENRSRGLRAVEGRKSPSPIDLAHGLYNSLYYRTSRDVEHFIRDNVTASLFYYFSVVVVTLPFYLTCQTHVSYVASFILATLVQLTTHQWHHFYASILLHFQLQLRIQSESSLPNKFIPFTTVYIRAVRVQGGPKNFAHFSCKMQGGLKPRNPSLSGYASDIGVDQSTIAVYVVSRETKHIHRRVTEHSDPADRDDTGQLQHMRCSKWQRKIV